MKTGSDGMKCEVKCVIEKRKSNKNALEVHKCKILTSVTAEVFRVDIPDEKTKITFCIQDIVTALDSANKRYMNLREQEQEAWIKDGDLETEESRWIY